MARVQSYVPYAKKKQMRVEMSEQYSTQHVEDVLFTCIDYQPNVCSFAKAYRILHHADQDICMLFRRTSLYQSNPGYDGCPKHGVKLLGFETAYLP